MTAPLQPLTAADVHVVETVITDRVRPESADLRSILIRPVPEAGELEIILDPDKDPRAVPAVLSALTTAGYPNRAQKAGRAISVYVSPPHALAGEDSRCVRCGAQGIALMQQCGRKGTPYIPRRPLSRDDVDTVLAAAWSQIEPCGIGLASDGQPALEAGVPVQAHPGKIEILCTVLHRHERVVVDAILKGLTDCGFAGVHRNVPMEGSGPTSVPRDDSFTMHSILVSGPTVAEPVQQVPGSASSMMLPGVLADVDLAMRGAGAALHSWMNVNRADLAHCPASEFVDLVLRFGLTYLTANAMITVAPEGAFERDVPVDLEEPYATALRRKVDEAVLRRSSLDAAAAAIRSR